MRLIPVTNEGTSSPPAGRTVGVPAQVELAQSGFAMLEVLIAIVISVVGILGLINLQARTYQAEAESYQRSQALVVLDDIAARLASNRNEAASYVGDGIGAGEPQDCEVEPTAASRDLCEIANQLRGTAETSAAGLVTPMTRPRACISNPAPNTYLIAVVWAGIVPTAAPANPCETGAYGDEGLRRAVSSVVVVADLEG